ncbi:MAG: adenosylcobinamide-GDP ribazoletransferase [Cellvibrionaceae bacterium]|nr:adenosylcobinamide-GDP ribazoletransferase [Cellvibrionaceae bacterium]
MKAPKSLIPLFIAVSLLTTLPVGALLPQQWSSRQQGFSVLWYPGVGVLLTALLVTFACLLPQTMLPLLSATLLVLLWVLLTGALHLDGLADAVDAAFAAHRLGGDRHAAAKVLSIFKDPNTGAMAVIALVFVLVLKIVLVSLLLQQSLGGLALALLLALVLSRALVIAAMLRTPYAREQGLGAGLFQHIPSVLSSLLLAAIVGVALLVLPGILSLGLLSSLVLLLCLWRALWMRLIGGFVGDCLGALIEIAEVMVLLIFYWTMIV